MAIVIPLTMLPMMPTMPWSVPQTYGTVEEVRNETRRLIDLGKDDGYIFAPAHSIEGDVPLENILAAVATVQNQPGYLKNQTHKK